ncbi:MAG: hypothetical protein KBS66_04565 [Eubacterium sp.]|nr:hypothetical protein [Candidatus Colimonas fimequi]
MDMFVIGKAVGFVVGIILAIVLIVIFAKNRNTDGSARAKYDERQKIVRGKGYAVGFYTAMGYFVVVLMFDILCVKFPLTTGMVAFLGLIITALACVEYCIIKDAYWGLNENKKSYKWFFGIVGLINLAIGINEVREEGFFIDGFISDNLINLTVGVFLIIILITVFIKDNMDKRAELEDTEEEE